MPKRPPPARKTVAQVIDEILADPPVLSSAAPLKVAQTRERARGSYAFRCERWVPYEERPLMAAGFEAAYRNSYTDPSIYRADTRWSEDAMGNSIATVWLTYDEPVYDPFDFRQYARSKLKDST